MSNLENNKYTGIFKAVLNTLLLQDPKKISEKLIVETLEKFLDDNNFKKYAFRSNLVKELVDHFIIKSTETTSLTNLGDHINWYLPDTTKTPMWNTYREYLVEEKRFSRAAVNDIDKSTDQMMSFIEDPKRPDSWDCRGLVVGSVQSGKTSNFLGLINKAVDHGYKLIVILSGLNKNLRQQTQYRVDESFLGMYTSNADLKANLLRFNDLGIIRSRQNIEAPNCWTTSDIDGDFNKSIASPLIYGDKPVCYVVKKNKSVLTSLISHFCKDPREPGIIIDKVKNSIGFQVRKQFHQGMGFIKNSPILIIDDECDQGSVDTGRQDYDITSETWDQDYDPKAINALIRTLLNLFSRKVYIAYTATPFANIFIHHERHAGEFGLDLFPKNFIVDLPIPENHIGLEKIFPSGTLDDGVVEDSEIRENIFFEIVDDHCDFPNDKTCSSGWLPPKHDKSWKLNEKIFPDTLKEAILSFILICACRNFRGYIDQPKSMLVHVTKFNDVQDQVFIQIEKYITEIRKLVEAPSTEYNSFIKNIENLWNKKFYKNKIEFEKEGYPEFNQLLNHKMGIGWVMNQICNNIKKLTGKSNDILDYQNFFNNNNFALHTIVVGGDKLQRGLTLEGLCVSYFLRSAQMPAYDTLMQMGRWFGYRPGYEDLCRLYTTRTMFIYFFKISRAMENLRTQFRIMADRKPPATPLEFGLLVETHPDLISTSIAKKRYAQKIKTCFQMEGTQTVTFYRDEKIIDSNFHLVENFIKILGDFNQGGDVLKRNDQSWRNSYLWENIDSSFVIDFLNNYQRYSEDPRTHSTKLYAKHIEKVNKYNELKKFTVCLFGNGSSQQEIFIAKKYKCNLIVRTPADTNIQGKISLKTTTQPKDETIDLDAIEYKNYLNEFNANKKKLTDANPDYTEKYFIRKNRSPQKGLICIYPILGVTDLSSFREYFGFKSKDGNINIEGHFDFEKINKKHLTSRPLMGIMLSFPRTEQNLDAVSVEWDANPVFQDQEAI